MPLAAPDSPTTTDRSEGFGERLLGTMIERAHEMPPHLIGPLVAEVIAAIGGSNVSVLLQDYEQTTLIPLTGKGLHMGSPEPIQGTPAGEAFLSEALVERTVADGVRLYLPLLDGTDRVGVLAFTSAGPDQNDRRLAWRFAGLLADILVTKGMYTDRFFQIRRKQPMSLSAEMQWSLLPPLSMTTPQVAVAGILEPAYSVAGDSFDYALNDNILHLAIIDAMGHDLDAATMATVAVVAYRHARRAKVDLAHIYTAMNAAITSQFDEERFVTAQMARLDVQTGWLQWVNAGHPHPLLIRNGLVVQTLSSLTTLPVGLNGHTPEVGEEKLEPGDRVLFFTDGIIEEHLPGGEIFGTDRLIEELERAHAAGGPVQVVVTRLSHALMNERGSITSDDATLFLLEWCAQGPSHLAVLDT